MRGIADAGFLIAFANRSDQHHEWAVQLAREVTDPLLTCDAVLAEASFHLEDAGIVMELVQAGLVKPAFLLTENISRMAELAKRYRDRQPDLADLCLIRMSELHPRHVLITTDVRGFRIYRRNRRDVIPLIYPPRKS